MRLQSSSPVAPRGKTEVDDARPMGLRPIPGFPSLFASNLPRQSRDSQAPQGRIAYRLATGFLISVVALAVVVLFDMFRPEVGAALIHLGEKIAGIGPQRQTLSPPSSSAQVPAPLSPSTETKPDVLQKETSGASPLPPDSFNRVDLQSQDLPIPRTKVAPDRSLRRQSPNVPQDRSAKAMRLWSSVASGNSSAGVDLARLYLSGEGVSRNCEQAKVLLQVAAKGGSVEAQQQLKKLRTSGCP